jgi:3,4-dihydroxy 2-butanone 4-phosphate synthase / GTP cyclohydrolase II
MPNNMLDGMRNGMLSSPEELIQEARNGRMFILVDDEDRENEGDLVVAAEMATPSVINFMATHGRGLICLALTKDRVNALGLDMMSRNNGTRHETAFTVSIEAKSGVTTGISAADRARTVSVAIDPNQSAADIVTPGHVFPLVAREGGVLVRAGHTEAAVDFARLAGLNPAGVICEIMKDDGTMARLPDLVAFAQFHNLKIGTIRDLITFRRRYDHLIEQTGETLFQSEWGGEWTAKSYWNKATEDEQFALIKGSIEPGKPALVRMHSLAPFPDMFGATGQRQGLLRRSMEIIGEEGSGIVVVINRTVGRRFDLVLKEQQGKIKPHEIEKLRNYGVGATILSALGVSEIILLTNSHYTPVGLDAYGLTIVGERRIDL